MQLFNGLWIFCGFCVFMSFMHEWVKLRHKKHSDSAEVVRHCDDIAQRMQALEERVANLETVMLEAEKHRRFEHELATAGSRSAGQAERS